MNKVSIRFGTSYRDSDSISGFNDDNKASYRILIECETKRGVIPVQFAREKDAEAGLKGLLKHIDLYNLSEDELSDALKELSPNKIREIVCNEMAW